MSAARRFVTTPIYYVNDRPHLGHAYTSVAADVVARWMRLRGDDVLFLTGTDEHGAKVEKAARDAGEEPRAFTDRVSGAFRALTATLGLSNDDFIRTTEPRHRAACEALWRRLAERGEIRLGAYEGWYAVRDEAFYGPDEVEERGGVRVAVVSGAPVEWTSEPSYFFRLSAWGERLLAHYEAHPEAIGPATRRNEVLSFLRAGLQDLSVSRASLRWGVPVPGDDAHVMYVWVDALANYLTAAGFPGDAPAWPADLHLVGKDILRFHAVYWPALLMAAGLEPPRRVFAHGWWTVEGQKMSKSLGNAVDPRALVEEVGLDPFRYFLLREVPFGGDGDFSRRALAARLNNELANDLGNLAQRTLSLVQRNLGGVRPDLGEPTADDRALLGPAEALPATVAEAVVERQAFHEALEAVWVVVRAANAWIDAQKPWALKKTDPERMAHVLAVLLQAIRVVATALGPFMPGTMTRLLDQLGDPLAGSAAGKGGPTPLPALAAPLPGGTALPPPEPLFRKVEAGAPVEA